MLTIHHLNNSRSQRILWLLEELGTDYDIRLYKRDEKTSRAPTELKAIHPLGKSPVIEHDDLIIAETGAIIVYLLDAFRADEAGKCRFRPEKGTQDFVEYVHFLHFAEGSAMLPLLLALYTGFLGDIAAPIQPMIMNEIKKVLDYCEYSLIRNTWFAGDELTGADFNMIFPLEAAKARGRLKGYDACNESVQRVWDRSAYRRALEKGGDYDYGPRVMTLIIRIFCVVLLIQVGLHLLHVITSGAISFEALGASIDRDFVRLTTALIGLHVTLKS